MHIWILNNSVTNGKYIHIHRSMNSSGVVPKAYWEEKKKEDENRKCIDFIGV